MSATPFKYAGTVSEATLRPDHLLSAFLPILQELDSHMFSQLTDGSDPFDQQVIDRLMLPGHSPAVLDWSDELMQHADEMVVWVSDALDFAAPEGYTFGTIEGDGACFGFWETETDEDDD